MRAAIIGFDAVEAAQFITKKDSLVLMEKLVKLSNWQDEDHYLNRTCIEDCWKTDNKNMKYISREKDPELKVALEDLNDFIFY